MHCSVAVSVIPVPICCTPCGMLLKVAGKEPLFIAPGVVVRLTRNLDKERGFVNGATGTIDVVLEDKSIFTVTLTGTKQRLLVHQITDGGDCFLPCPYGYATTIRRAQGSSLGLGALYFDHCYPPERGYGYVGASRFRIAERIYHFGCIRRTDWLPVLKNQDDPDPDEQTTRSAQSESDDEYGPGPRDSDSESDISTASDDSYFLMRTRSPGVHSLSTCPPFLAGAICYPSRGHALPGCRRVPRCWGSPVFRDGRVVGSSHSTCHQGAYVQERQQGGHGITVSLESAKRRWSAYAGQQVQG